MTILDFAPSYLTPETDPVAQGVFDRAAQDAVRKWVYEPRKENGVAVESTAKARLVFDAAN